MKWIVVVGAALIVGAAVMKSHYDGMCHQYHFAGAAVTVQGVFCWRRVNSAYDDFTPLRELVEKEMKQHKYERCIEAHPDAKWFCDPRYVPPVTVESL